MFKASLKYTGLCWETLERREEGRGREWQREPSEFVILV